VYSHHLRPPSSSNPEIEALRLSVFASLDELRRRVRDLETSVSGCSVVEVSEPGEPTGCGRASVSATDKRGRVEGDVEDAGT
jgi:hypothetical protein